MEENFKLAAHVTRTRLLECNIKALPAKHVEPQDEGYFQDTTLLDADETTRVWSAKVPKSHDHLEAPKSRNPLKDYPAIRH